ncbi:dihydrofolate reductase family protein [Pelagibacterium xiamenense]|uniref:dihydrofolate reductase family protein n=1 Tax=Pelagibacterium xiamenense TaxID=2901140 RepID=UPI001E596ABC|nr:dihydrofolate reductase family protein [Pelagibacterium xiamenense]MCD7059471.1 dihydrofolate reductase family protein [Pelagibacterium xiamenense]
MRKLIVWNVMSLDGYFEGTEPWSLDFHTTVWGQDLEEFSLKQGNEIGTLLFGRRTYDGMAAYWTQETGAIADMMNAVEKAVVSRTLEAANWTNTRLLKGDLAAIVGDLKAEDKKDIFVFGSAELVNQLLDLGLVDEYRICIAPILLGKGTPLFSAGMTPLKLLEARPVDTGGILARYAAEPRTAQAG